MSLLNRGRGRGSSPDDLRRRVAALHEEIVKLEQVLDAPAAGDDTGTSDVAVRRLRASIVSEELTRKRAEFSALEAEARAAGIDVEQAIAEPLPARAVPVAGGRGGFSPAARPRTRPQLLPVAVGLAGIVIVILLVVVGLTTGLIGGRTGQGATPPIGETGPLAEPLELAPAIPSERVAQRGEVFFTREVEFTVQRGRIWLSGDPPPNSPFSADDSLRLEVTRPDGTTSVWSRDFNTGCIRTTTVPPQDVTTLFQWGVNRIKVTLADTCGENRGADAPIWLVNRE